MVPHIIVKIKITLLFILVDSFSPQHTVVVVAFYMCKLSVLLICYLLSELDVFFAMFRLLVVSSNDIKF